MRALAVALFCLSLQAFGANEFHTSYASFDIPDGWRCDNTQGVFVCQSGIEPDRKDSVVLSIATIATDWDSIENYEEYLKQPRTVQDEDGTQLTSEVRYVRKRNINGHVWIDSLQYNSELPGFWARYVATVHQTPKAKLAILITYVVSDERYKILAPQFERMVASLKPNAEFDLNIATRQGDGPIPGSEKLGPLQKELLSKALKKGKTEVKKDEPMDTNMLLVGVGVIAVLGIVVLRRRRKAKAAAQKPRTPTQPQPPTRRAS